MRDMHIEARRVATLLQGDRKGTPLFDMGLARRFMAYLSRGVTWWSPRFFSLMSLSSCMPDFIRRQIYYDFSQNNLAIRRGRFIAPTANLSALGEFPVIQMKK